MVLFKNDNLKACAWCLVCWHFFTTVPCPCVEHQITLAWVWTLSVRFLFSGHHLVVGDIIFITFQTKYFIIRCCCPPSPRLDNSTNNISRDEQSPGWWKSCVNVGKNKYFCVVLLFSICWQSDKQYYSQHWRFSHSQLNPLLMGLLTLTLTFYQHWVLSLKWLMVIFSIHGLLQDQCLAHKIIWRHPAFLMDCVSGLLTGESEELLETVCYNGWPFE